MATKTVILVAVNGDSLVDISAEDVTANVVARDPAPTRSNVPTRVSVPSRSVVPSRPIGY
jgi:hypothetical protein